MENTDLEPVPLSLHIKDTPTPLGSWLAQFFPGDGEVSEEGKVPKDSIPHHEDFNQKDLDALVAQDLNQMTLKERGAMYEELHGVESIIEETPEFVDDRLRSLDIELRKIKMKPAYEQAERTTKGYVTDTKFRLMFLRVEHFDAEKAATRLVNFMEGKLEYFGPGALARPLYLTDLDKDDMETLKSGFFQLLPARDRAGRAIIGDFQRLSTPCYKRTENMMKTIIYTLLAAVEDEETQRRGFVGLLYYVGSAANEFDHDLFSRGTRCIQWLPVRMNGFHMCSNHPMVRVLRGIIMLSMGRDSRAKLRMYDGTHTECQYGLMTFGIPVHSIPITNDGELKTTNHLKWIARRKIKDTRVKDRGVFDAIDLPRRNDVLLGRGKPFHEHTGNIIMRSVVEALMNEYTLAPVGQKTVIVQKVFDAVRSNGGRFLNRRRDGWWVQVSDDEARSKVSHAFRTVRSTRKATGDPSRRFVSMETERKRARIPSGGECLQIFCESVAD